MSEAAAGSFVAALAASARRARERRSLDGQPSGSSAKSNLLINRLVEKRSSTREKDGLPVECVKSMKRLTDDRISVKFGEYLLSHSAVIFTRPRGFSVDEH